MPGLAVCGKQTRLGTLEVAFFAGYLLSVRAVWANLFLCYAQYDGSTTFEHTLVVANVGAVAICALLLFAAVRGRFVDEQRDRFVSIVLLLAIFAWSGELYWCWTSFANGSADEGVDADGDGRGDGNGVLDLAEKYILLVSALNTKALALVASYFLHGVHAGGTGQWTAQDYERSFRRLFCWVPRGESFTVHKVRGEARIEITAASDGHVSRHSYDIPAWARCDAQHELVLTAAAPNKEGVLETKTIRVANSSAADCSWPAIVTTSRGDVEWKLAIPVGLHDGAQRLIRSTDSKFKSLGVFSKDFFGSVNLTVSDIVAGLVLLKREQSARLYVHGDSEAQQAIAQESVEKNALARARTLQRTKSETEAKLKVAQLELSLDRELGAATQLLKYAIAMCVSFVPAPLRPSLPSLRPSRALTPRSFRPPATRRSFTCFAHLLCRVCAV